MRRNRKIMDIENLTTTEQKKLCRSLENYDCFPPCNTSKLENCFSSLTRVSDISGSSSSSTPITSKKIMKRLVNSSIPEGIVRNPEINEAITRALPINYDFEIHKTIWRIFRQNAKHVLLQMPEGLLQWAPEIACILQHFSCAELVTILGDVTYGACCVEDLVAAAAGCDLLVHYGHSCLVNSKDLDSNLGYLYIFVQITTDVDHLVTTLEETFKPTDSLALFSTIQFTGVAHSAKKVLLRHQYFSVPPYIPQELPLSHGELLGCTAPVLHKRAQHSCTVLNESNKNNYNSSTMNSLDNNYVSVNCDRNINIKDDYQTEVTYLCSDSENCREKHNCIPIDYAIFIGDGRFHLESALIQNPDIPFFKYDPFTNVLTRERYDIELLHKNRQDAIEKARQGKVIGLILGTLGRQGNVGLLHYIANVVAKSNRQFYILLLAEITPLKLGQFTDTDAFVQVACPRLSIDWGQFFPKPLLNSYEALVAFGNLPYLARYPMDYYSKHGGLWSNCNCGRNNGNLSLGNKYKNRNNIQTVKSRQHIQIC